MTHAPALSDPNRLKFSPVAIFLHWTIAALIIANILLAWKFDGLKGLAQFRLIQLHKSLGISVLIFSVLRFAWRLAHPPPAYPPELKGWERVAASTVHWGFYAFMVLMPLSGWLMVSASPTNLPTRLFNLVPWPHIGLVHGLPMDQRKPLAHQFGFVHTQLANIAYVLIVVHVAAALKHQFLDRDRVLWRMAPIPGLKPRGAGSEEVP